MAAGSRSRERVPTIDEVKNDHYSNMMQAEFGGNKYLLAVKDSVQVVLTSFHSEGELRTWVMENLASVRMFDINSSGRLTRELSRTQISELPLPEEAARAPAETAAATSHSSAVARADEVINAIRSGDFGSVTYMGDDGRRHRFSRDLDEATTAYLRIHEGMWKDPNADARTMFRDMLISFFEYAGTGSAGMEELAGIFSKMASDIDHTRRIFLTKFYDYASGGAKEHLQGIFESAYNHYWRGLADGKASWDYRRPSTFEIAPSEEAFSPNIVREEPVRLGKETNARTRQIVRALESRTYEGITFPGTAGARAEFFQQFSDQERSLLQRAWDLATPKERELFAAELNAFFAETGDGPMGMMTAAKILQRMASDYLSHQDAYAQSRFFTIADFYYYTSDVMADEKTVGGAREHSIGSIGREMKGAIERKYQRLVAELKEERRTAIIRRLPGLEQVPTPAEGARVSAPAERAAPVEAAAEAQAETAAAVEAAAVQMPSELQRMYNLYTQIEFDQHLISRLPADSPQLPNLQASMRAHEDRFLEFVQTLPPEVQEAAKFRVRAINDRRAAELSAPAAATVEAAPVEEAPATAAVESAPAEAAQVEIYDYSKFRDIADHLANILMGRGYDVSSPDIFDIPDFGEEVHGLYTDIKAHFADLDAMLARGGLTDLQVNFLTSLRASVESALAGE